jgi:maleate isomerase
MITTGKIVYTAFLMSKRNRIFLGMLTPSSNTTLEPVTARMLAGLPEVTPHFGRFRVTEISLADQALGQFEPEPMLAAAQLLADARCHSICWNGTSAGWLGFERDRELCRAIEVRTRVRACSSVLAIEEIFRATGVTRFGMVSPYTEDIVAAIRRNFGREGFELTAERHLGIKVNFDFSEIEPETIAGMAREVAKQGPQAIIVFCTNMDGASLAENLERELGIPIYDTIATAVWAALRTAGVRPERVKGWGRLFREIT